MQRRQLCLFPQRPMHIVNCRGQCIHKGGYCQSPTALCPSSVLRPVRPWWPQGQPIPLGPKRISVTLAPGRLLGLSVQKAPLFSTGETRPWEVSQSKVSLPCRGSCRGTRTGGCRHQEIGADPPLTPPLSLVSLVTCQPPELQAQQRGSQHILLHTPAPNPKCGSSEPGLWSQEPGFKS